MLLHYFYCFIQQHQVINFQLHNTLFGITSNNEITKRGALDACKYYSGYKGAATGTFVTTFLVGGILGLIPAISTSSTTPKEKNLNMPDVPLMQEPDYITAYQKQAKNIKSGKVWGNYAMGLLTAITTVLLISTLASAQ